jgi:hypothetical protein
MARTTLKPTEIVDVAVGESKTISEVKDQFPLQAARWHRSRLKKRGIVWRPAWQHPEHLVTGQSGPCRDLRSLGMHSFREGDVIQNLKRRGTKSQDLVAVDGLLSTHAPGPMVLPLDCYSTSFNIHHLSHLLNFEPLRET